MRLSTQEVLEAGILYDLSLIEAGIKVYQGQYIDQLLVNLEKLFKKLKEYSCSYGEFMYAFFEERRAYFDKILTGLRLLIAAHPKHIKESDPLYRQFLNLQIAPTMGM